MGIFDKVTIAGGLCSTGFWGLIPGTTLLFKRGYGAALAAAEVTVVEILYEEEKCKVKIDQIVSQGAATNYKIGDVLVATSDELTAV